MPGMLLRFPACDAIPAMYSTGTHVPAGRTPFAVDRVATLYEGPPSTYTCSAF